MLWRARVDRLQVSWYRYGMKWIAAAISLSVWLGVFSNQALACRYNVRDVGFVDLDRARYQFVAFVRNSTPDAMVADLKEASAAVLAECNVDSEIVNLDLQPNHPSAKHLPSLAEEGTVAGVLVSPDGQTLPVDLGGSGADFRSKVTAALHHVTDSPARQEIVKKVTSAFGVVLLLEGKDKDANQIARKAVEESLRQVTQQMKLMPKAVEAPPVLQVIEPPSLEREKVLLWSLGLDTTASTEPRAAILYGRARWIGPLMKGAEITERNLTGLLSLIGADCECGLDIGWTQGTRLPVRWSEEPVPRLVRSLGFDPESPMVKLEVGRILATGGVSRSASVGYQEIALDEVGSLDAMSTNRLLPIHAAVDPLPLASSPGAPADGPREASRGRLFLPVLFLSLTILSWGAFILLRAKRRARP